MLLKICRYVEPISIYSQTYTHQLLTSEVQTAIIDTQNKDLYRVVLKNASPSKSTFVVNFITTALQETKKNVRKRLEAVKITNEYSAYNRTFVNVMEPFVTMTDGYLGNISIVQH